MVYITYQCLETSEYPLSQGIFWVVDGQNDPSEQKISPLRPTSAHMFAPPQVWLGRPGGSW